MEEKVNGVLNVIDSIQHVVEIEYVDISSNINHVSVVSFDNLLDNEPSNPSFEQLPFDHPLYIMYSSGTTGPPKSIIHSSGGTLIQHMKEHQLHCDVKPGKSKMFWFTTCGWMMWNWLVSGLSSGATIVLYDGSPSYPNIDKLWRMIDDLGITHFGTSPKFLSACDSNEILPKEFCNLDSLESILSTGSPLVEEQFDWVYSNVKSDIQLSSISGGTDIIGCFLAGSPILPVFKGELQCPQLGMSVDSWNEDGVSTTGEKGELVCTKPFPSMPIGFWNDADGSKYISAYFSEFEGVWTHGDYLEITKNGGAIIYGRSDTTLNPGGVRIGTAEIYRSIENFEEVIDSVVIGHNVLRYDWPLLTAEFTRIGQLPPKPHATIDTLRLAKRLRIPGRHDLGTLCRGENISLNNAHDAAADAGATLLLLWRFMAKYPRHFHRSPIELESWILTGDSETNSLGPGIEDLESLEGTGGKIRKNGDIKLHG